MQSLLATALAGTGRQPVAAPALPGPVGALLTGLQAGGDGTALLRMAGALSVCGQAGALPSRDTVPLQAAAPPDTRPPTDDSFGARVLAPLLADGPERLQHEAFSAVARAGWRLAPALLPAALEAGRRAVTVREPLAQVLGARGHWLAAANPAWRYASGVTAEAPVEERWSHGSAEQRRAVFAQWRAADPAAARERLAAELGDLNARERAEFVGLLAIGLSPADEPLLDGLLKDRGRDVRHGAARLLSRLPDSRHARVVTTALAPLVQVEKKLLRTRLVVDAPEQADAAWKDEALDPDRPTHDGLGERAWWLYQLVRHAPLAWWPAHTGLEPAALVAGSAKSEWKDALQRGWREATLAAGDVAWAEALLAELGPRQLGGDQPALLAVLSLADRERHWKQQLDAGTSSAGELLPQLLAAVPCGQCLPAALSHRLASALRAEWAGGNNHTLRHLLPDAACLLDAGALQPLLEAVRGPDPWPGGDTVARVERIIAARRALAALPQEDPPPIAPTP